MLKLNTAKKKNNVPKYAAGGVVVVIVLGMWISMPLMNGDAAASVAAGNPFSSRVSDISMLGSDIAAEGAAPGSPLTGDMINNPATSGEELLSSLFSSGLEGDAPVTEASADASAEAPAAPDAPAGAGPSGGGPALARGKLAPTASFGSGGGGSQTSGGTHGKFFGSGNTKAELAPISALDAKKVMSEGSGPKAAAMLENATKQSKLAMQTSNVDASRGGASSAFSGGGKGATTENLGGKQEEASAVAGMELGQATANLKTSDPKINKREIKVPTPTKAPPSEEDDLKKMIIKMFLQAMIGSMFSGVGAAPAAAS